ncbi:hypothetical protein [Xylanibacter muris]|uniref:Uncharacterized protein n=1 Tax=Xylanibacter muris TaxID=2736290 RepID=A0ABX2AKU4_9BACT|nr:hypothetical protein [Xylanibacter muris]NPD91730.1 hypothetical protein [Xylanibacter muris]
MKKTIYFLLLLLICNVRPTYGDEIKSVKLDNREHNKETIALPFCNIFVELLSEDENDQYGISVKLENISEDKILYLFDKSYNEKTLKKMSIVYDKLFPGAKRKRVAEACVGMSESCRLLPSSDTKNIISVLKNDTSFKYRLPIYIARYDEKNFIIVKKNRISLAQKEVIELNIDVELKPDEEYLKLSVATDKLIGEIGRQTFCSNRNHRGASLKKLHKIYKESIDDLKKQVQQTVNSRNYMSTDKGFKQFMSITERLDSIKLEQLTVNKCDKDIIIRPSSHNCKYCRLQIEEIYKRLEACYIDIHNGKKAKGQVIGEAEALYNCAQKNNRRTTGSYMSGISKYYNRIKSR